MRKLNNNEVLILNRIQHDMPIMDEIFHVVAKDTSIPLKEVIDTIKEFEADEIITGICADFSSSKLGYHSATAALKVSALNIKNSFKIISKEPNIVSAVVRDNDFNIWVKFYIPAEIDAAEYLAEICNKTSADDSRLFKTKLKIVLNTKSKSYPWSESGKKIPVIDMLDSCRTHDSFVIPAEIHHNNIMEENNTIKVGEIYFEFSSGLNMHFLEKEEIPVVQILQKKLPLCENPFSELLIEQSSNLTIDELQKTAAALKNSGILKKYYAMLPEEASTVNIQALTCWDLGNKDLNRTIGFFKKITGISSLSIMESETSPWNYNLFAEIYAADYSELQKIISYISAGTEITDFCILKNLEEIKNERIEYFG